jgi:hypothetical protein
VEEVVIVKEDLLHENQLHSRTVVVRASLGSRWRAPGFCTTAKDFFFSNLFQIDTWACIFNRPSGMSIRFSALFLEKV